MWMAFIILVVTRPADRVNLRHSLINVAMVFNLS
jgi:hypothetical protein